MQAGQGGFAALAGAEQGYHRVTLQTVIYGNKIVLSLKHSRNLAVKVQDFKLFSFSVTGLRKLPGHRWKKTSGIPLVYGLAAMIVPLLAVALYLCTHPGYVVSVLPGAALTAAAMTAGASARFPTKAFAGAVSLVVAMFLFMSPINPPASKWQAVAGGILLQYSAGCSRDAVFNTTARWLRLGGLEAEIPAHRLIDLRQEDDWREHLETVRPR